MRAPSLAFAAVLLSLALAALAALAQAGDPCPWKDPGKTPRLFVEDRIAYFRDYYVPRWAACAADGAREVEIQWIAGSDPSAAPIKTEKLRLQGGAADTPSRIEARLFHGPVCDGPRPASPSPRLVTTGLPGEEEVSELVPLRVHVKARGALTPLDYTSPPVDFPCPACPVRREGSAAVHEAENGRDLVLEVSADRAWFECARTGATLSLLGFAGDSQRDVLDAVQPDLVIAGLEKELAAAASTAAAAAAAAARKSDTFVLRKTLPTPRLCAKKPRFWSFELWGRGPLMALGGGGRDLHELKCR